MLSSHTHLLGNEVNGDEQQNSDVITQEVLKGRPLPSSPTPPYHVISQDLVT